MCVEGNLNHLFDPRFSGYALSEWNRNIVIAEKNWSELLSNLVHDLLFFAY